MDPFSPEQILNPPLAGEDIFLCRNNNVDLHNSNTSEQDVWNMSALSANPNDLNLADLSGGFEDNFLDVWGKGEGTKGGSVYSPSSLEKDKEMTFSFNDDEDPVFRTVSGMRKKISCWSQNLMGRKELEYVGLFFFNVLCYPLAVSAEDDDLWSSLPEEVLASHGQQLLHLQRSLDRLNSEFAAVNNMQTQLVLVSVHWQYLYVHVDVNIFAGKACNW